MAVEGATAVVEAGIEVKANEVEGGPGVRPAGTPLKIEVKVARLGLIGTP